MPTQKKRLNSLTVIALISLAIPFAISAAMFFGNSLYAASAVQQPRERMLKRLPFPRNEPLEITGLKFKGKGVWFDEKFVAEEDWIKDLVISVKNKSDKRILYFSVDIFLPPIPGLAGQHLMLPLSYGNSGLKRDHSPSLQERLVGLEPGATTDIQMTNPKYESFLRIVAEKTDHYPSIERVDLRLDQIIFEDDTMWDLGDYFRRDPADPSRWIPTYKTPSQARNNESGAGLQSPLSRNALRSCRH